MDRDANALKAGDIANIVPEICSDEILSINSILDSMIDKIIAHIAKTHSIKGNENLNELRNRIMKITMGYMFLSYAAWDDVKNPLNIYKKE